MHEWWQTIEDGWHTPAYWQLIVAYGLLMMDVEKRYYSNNDWLQMAFELYLIIRWNSLVQQIWDMILICGYHLSWVNLTWQFYKKRPNGIGLVHGENQIRGQDIRARCRDKNCFEAWSILLNIFVAFKKAGWFRVLALVRLMHAPHGYGGQAGCPWAWWWHAWHGWRTGWCPRRDRPGRPR